VKRKGGIPPVLGGKPSSAEEVGKTVVGRPRHDGLGSVNELRGRPWRPPPGPRLAVDEDVADDPAGARHSGPRLDRSDVVAVVDGVVGVDESSTPRGLDRGVVAQVHPPPARTGAAERVRAEARAARARFFMAV